MTTLIKQRTDIDCGVAALAMASGRDYDDVITTIGDAYDEDIGLQRVQEALKRLGFKNEFANGEPIGDIVCLSRDWCITPAFFRRLIWGRRALVTVPSLNTKGVWHMVYFDGSHVFDPSPKQTYTEYKQLEPNELVLFREVKA